MFSGANLWKFFAGVTPIDDQGGDGVERNRRGQVEKRWKEIVEKPRRPSEEKAEEEHSQGEENEGDRQTADRKEKIQNERFVNVARIAQIADFSDRWIVQIDRSIVAASFCMTMATQSLS